MDGRLELQEKDFKQAELNLLDMPSYVNEWYLSLRANNLSAKTCRDYICKLKRYFLSLHKDIKTITPKELTYPTVASYIISCQVIEDSNGNKISSSYSYQNTIWSCLNNFFSFLLDEEYIDKNPMARISRPGGSDLAKINEKRILLTKRDFNKILVVVENGCGSDKAKSYQDNTKNRDLAIMYLFMCTGIRESALVSININNINYDSGMLFIKDKGDIDHKYKLTDQCLYYINQWLIDRNQYHSDSEALFLSSRGERISVSSISNLVEKYTKAALGKSLTPHKLRSGVCSILYKETKDIEFVRRFIGHSDVSITKRYIVTGGDEIEKGNQILSSILN